MIDNLDLTKSGTFGGIPTNCLKGVSDISAKFLNSVWNNEVLKDLNFDKSKISRYCASF